MESILGIALRGPCSSWDLGSSLLCFSYGDIKSNPASSHPSSGVWSRLDFYHPRDFDIIVDRKTEVISILMSIQFSHDNLILMIAQCSHIIHSRII
jgi:hypothetical protein